MATSSDMPDTTQQTPRPKPKLGMIALGLLLILAVAAAAFVFGYALRGTEPVEAAAAKTDPATKMTGPKCGDGETSFILGVNKDARRGLTVKGTFDGASGLAGDLLVSAEATADGLPAARVTKLYTWEPSSGAGGKPGWLVTRYIVPEPTSLIVVKNGQLSAKGEVAICVLTS